MGFKKIIGILGGMGPYATIDVYKLILDSIHAENERDYPHIIITSNPQMPSRTRAFLFGEKSPVPYLIKEARRLESAGADFIIVPCNSAHLFLEEVRKNIGIEILDIVKITVEHIKKKYPYFKKICVLGGEIVLEGALYERDLKEKNIDVIRLHDKDKALLRKTIDMIKHNKFDSNLVVEFNDLISRVIKMGAEAIVLGCTELPILFRDIKASVPVIDSNRLIVEYAIRRAQSE